MKTRQRLHSESGIAIGMILFVISLLAVITIAVSSSGNFMGTTVTPDRVTADIKSQANLIRSKIMECFMNGRSNERGDLADLYPASTGAGTAVTDLDCPSFTSGQQNLWTGQSPASLPPPTTGFDPWMYKNAGSVGGRCIRIQPTSGFVNDLGTKNGLAQVSTAFSSNERIYDSGSSSQRLIIWITRPTGAADADCGS
jgi:hypothetical protein